MNWDELDYWNTGEWQVVQEKLDDLDKAKIAYNPARESLFAALDALSFEKVTVAIIGQDPYPKSIHATGVAFSIPEGIKDYPPTLKNIFQELQNDLTYPDPKSGNLNKWVKQGVLLWNVFPSCEEGKPGSHHWDEWLPLTQEIVTKLDKQSCVVFVLLGAEARKFSKYIENSDVIETSHPSPLGANKGFFGSRIFSTVNAKLAEAGMNTVDWSL